MAFTVRVVVAGSMLGDDYPSETLRASGRTIEVVPMAAQGAGGPAPGVLLVHDESSQARRLLQLANAYAQRGWNVLVVSQPGYGTSSGARDWAGPGTLAALSAALDKLKATRGVDPARLYVQGSGLGATAALLLAAQRNDLAGVIASSPEPDLWSAWRGADEPLHARIVAEAGRDSAAWRARSPLSQTSRIRTRLCLIQYSGGSASGLAASRALVTALDRPGQRVDAHLPDAQHRVDRRELNRIVTGFISAADH